MASRALRRFIFPFACAFTFLTPDNLFTSTFYRALAIASTQEDSFTRGMIDILNYNFRRFGQYRLELIRVSNGKELSESIRMYPEKGIDDLILSFHGFPNSIYFSDTDSISSSEIKNLLKDHDRYFSPNASVLLYSCSTGKGKENFARALFETIKRNVTAPKRVIFPEAYIDSTQRVGEFSLDSNGRLMFDYDNYMIYLRFNSGSYVHYDVLAPVSYSTNPFNVPTPITPKPEEMFLILKKQD